jgi:ppGpp synthetase/RelA/SpoT-type nucleotidyltranferase
VTTEGLGEQFAAERPRYERLARWLGERLKTQVRAAGVYEPLVDSRAKEVDSFVKKAVRGPYSDPLAQITDKAGVRIIVALTSEVRLVEAVVAENFDVREHVNKADELDDDQFAYLGIHFLVTPRAQDLDDTTAELFDHVCEIQIHTRAQSAWALVAHPLTYKGPAGAASVRRRINRLTALVELFDSEVEVARNQVMNDPGYPEATMLQSLERRYYPLAQRDFDQQLSLFLLRVLRDAYTPEELADFDTLISSFLEDEGGADYLRSVFDRETGNASASELLFQPETILILERLNHAKARLQYTWNQCLEARLLERLSATLGRPV